MPRQPVAPYIRTAPGSNGAPVLPPSLAQKFVFRPLSCMRIPVSSQVPLLRPGLRRWSWQGFFFFPAGTVVLRWSEKGDSLGVGAEKNPNASRRLGSRSWTEPCHAGTEGFSESVCEEDFTAKGEKGGKANQRGDAVQVVTQLPHTHQNSRKSLVHSRYVIDITRTRQKPGDPSFSLSRSTDLSCSFIYFQITTAFAVPIIHI